MAKPDYPVEEPLDSIPDDYLFGSYKSLKKAEFSKPSLYYEFKALEKLHEVDGWVVKFEAAFHKEVKGEQRALRQMNETRERLAAMKEDLIQRMMREENKTRDEAEAAVSNIQANLL